MVFALYLVFVFAVPATVGVFLGLSPIARHKFDIILRLLLTLSLLPWTWFLIEMSKWILVSVAEYPSLTYADFIGAAAPGIIAVLVAWVLALVYARSFPMWSTALPLVAATLAAFSTLGSVREAALVITPEGEPFSGLSFDGLYALWLFIYSSAVWLGLACFVGTAHKSKRHKRRFSSNSPSA